MRFAFLIAMSHLRSRNKAVGVSFITTISVVGVTVGVAALIIVLSVMAGFEIDLRDKILGSNAHVVVLRYGSGIEDHEAAIKKVEALDGVEQVINMIEDREKLSEDGRARCSCCSKLLMIGDAGDEHGLQPACHRVGVRVRLHALERRDEATAQVVHRELAR